MVLMNLFAGQESRCREWTRGHMWGRGGEDSERVALTYIYTLSCIKQRASGKLLSSRLCDGLVGWEGGGGRSTRERDMDPYS